MIKIIKRQRLNIMGKTGSAFPGDLFQRRTGRPRAVLALAGMAVSFLLAACGSNKASTGNTNPPPVTNVTLSPSSATVNTGATRQFTASVSGSTDQSVVWEVDGTVGGNFVRGWISRGGVYIAPNTVPNPPTVTITAISMADASKTGSATVTIQTGSAVSVAISETVSPVIVPTFGSHTFTATVAGNSNTAVTWMVNTVVGGTAVTGTISGAGVYSAPHSAPVSTAANNDGQATDVIITARSQADATASDSVVVLAVPPQQGRYSEPIPLGTSGGNSHDRSSSGANTLCCGGTLGALVSRGGKLYILSNNHVLARTDIASIGDTIVQPALVDNDCTVSGANVVATLAQFFNLETGTSPHVDAGLAEIQPGAADPLGTIVQLGGTTNGDQPTDGTPNPGPGVAPTIGQAVAKSGSATGLTCGVILAINLSVSVEYQKGCGTGSTFTTVFQNQIDIPGVGFSASGDSGSLIVTQNTADPVGLLFGGSDSDTVANPVANVLSQLADPVTKEVPVFAGDTAAGPHPVAACSLPLPQAAAGLSLTAEVSEATAGLVRRATSARDAHLSELLALAGVQAVGVGASCDNPQEPAVLLFVKRGQPKHAFPSLVGGVRTRIVEGSFEVPAGPLSAASSTAWDHEAGAPLFIQAVEPAEVERARAVHAVHGDELLTRRGVQGVGVASSLDSPGEAALVIFVIRGMKRDPIPPVIDGLRTRIRETDRFRAR